MADLELRLVRYFIAVAERRSFTAAAAALHLSQPALSQAVRRLEDALGARLLDRGVSGFRGGVALTPAGEAFLPAAHQALRASEHAVQSVRDHGRPVRLVVGFGTDTPRDYIRLALDIGQSEPSIEVVPQHVPWGGVRDALTGGEVDLVFLQTPSGWSDPDLRLAPLSALRRVAVFRIDHPLAGRERLVMDDLASEPIIDAASDRAYWLVDPRPDGSSPPVVGPAARSSDEMFALVTAGQGMAITASTVASTNRSDELTFVPIDDLASSVVHLAVRASDQRPALDLLFTALEREIIRSQKAPARVSRPPLP